jgi:hypothetical protein
MDTVTELTETRASRKYRRGTTEEKRRIVEKTAVSTTVPKTAKQATEQALRAASKIADAARFTGTTHVIPPPLLPVPRAAM